MRTELASVEWRGSSWSGWDSIPATRYPGGRSAGAVRHAGLRHAKAIMTKGKNFRWGKPILDKIFNVPFGDG